MFGLDQQTTVFLVVFIAIVATLALLMLPYMGKQNRTKKRVQALAIRREELYKSRLSTEKKRNSLKEKQNFASRLLGGKADMSKKEDIQDYQKRLVKAGFRGQNAVFNFLFIRLVSLVGVPLLLFLYYSFQGMPLTTLRTVFIAMSAGIGFLLPSFVLDRLIKRRQLAITRAFPDAIDMMVVCAEAGLGVDAALKRVTSEMFEIGPEIAEELAIMLVELNFFDEREKAFTNFHKRISGMQARSFANTLMQTEKYGTSISHSFRVLSEEFRKDRMSMAEEKANSLAVKMTLPMILFILVPLILIIGTPPALSIMDNL